MQIIVIQEEVGVTIMPTWDLYTPLGLRIQAV